LLVPSLVPSFVCPISCQLMRDPVIAADGHSYERLEIQRWLACNATSPKTGSELVHQALVRNHSLRNAIEEWLSTCVKEGEQWAVKELEKVRAPLPEFEDMAQALINQFEERNRVLVERLTKLSEEHRSAKQHAAEQCKISERLDERRMDQMDQMEMAAAAAKGQLEIAQQETATALEEAVAAKEELSAAKEAVVAALAEAVAAKEETVEATAQANASKAEAATAKEQAAREKEEAAREVEEALASKSMLTEKLRLVDAELVARVSAATLPHSKPDAHKATQTARDERPPPLSAVLAVAAVVVALVAASMANVE